MAGKSTRSTSFIDDILCLQMFIVFTNSCLQYRHHLQYLQLFFPHYLNSMNVANSQPGDESPCCFFPSSDVLDQDRQAMQKSWAFLTAVPHDFPGLLPRTVEAGDGTGMDQGFSGRYSLLHDINELQRRHGACFQHGDDLMRLTKRAEVLKQWDVGCCWILQPK